MNSLVKDKLVLGVGMKTWTHFSSSPESLSLFLIVCCLKEPAESLGPVCFGFRVLFFLFIFFRSNPFKFALDGFNNGHAQAKGVRFSDRHFRAGSNTIASSTTGKTLVNCTEHVGISC